jgi:hypothetical protein
LWVGHGTDHPFWELPVSVELLRGGGAKMLFCRLLTIESTQSRAQVIFSCTPKLPKLGRTTDTIDYVHGMGNTPTYSIENVTF